VLVAALGIDGDGNKHPLGLIEGATENAAVVQALIDNLIERPSCVDPGGRKDLAWLGRDGSQQK
jgi:hypothetical protein